MLLPADIYAALGVFGLGKLMALTCAEVVRCEAHEFGRHGLAADVRAVRSADVLVAMPRTRQPNPNPRPRPRPRPEPYRSR